MISAYTISMGNRPYYLAKLMHTMILNQPDYKEWHIGVHNREKRGDIKLTDKQTLHEWEGNCGAGESNNRMKEYLTGDIIVKLDDDALPISKDYFKHIEEIFRITKGKCVFSPYPVGLINNPGGVLSKNHHVVYGENTDTYYTFRQVHHIGGFARIMPANIFKDFVWPYDYSPHNSGREDVNFSEHCIRNNIPMLYLENALIVEHQESTLGQKERYKGYFKGRF